MRPRAASAAWLLPTASDSVLLQPAHPRQSTDTSPRGGASRYLSAYPAPSRRSRPSRLQLASALSSRRLPFALPLLPGEHVCERSRWRSDITAGFPLYLSPLPEQRLLHHMSFFPFSSLSLA